MPDSDGRLSDDEFLLEEYRAYRDFVARNEAAGETRINLFLTLNSALVAVLALGDRHALTATDGAASTVLILLLVALLLVGRSVLVRTVRRNMETTRALHHVDLLRGRLIRGDRHATQHLLWQPKYETECKPRPSLSFNEFLVPRKGGLVEMVALLNSFLCGTLAGVITLRVLSAFWPTHAADLAIWAGGVSVAGFLAGWQWHTYEVEERYNERVPGEKPIREWWKERKEEASGSKSGSHSA